MIGVRRATQSFGGALVRIPRQQQLTSPANEDEVEEVQVQGTGSPFLDKWIVFLNPSELQGPILWRGALIEFYASAVLTFMSSCSVRTATNAQLDFPPTSIAIFNGALLVLMIYAAARPSGGHVNPLITLATTLVGLTSPMRCFLYIPAQLLGSALGSFFFRSGLGLWGEKVTAMDLAGCVVPHDMDLSQAFCLEFFSSFFIFLVAFGCALDPVVGRVYGPLYAPVLVGVAVGMTIWATAALVPGYTGAGVNPARCFGPTLLSNDGWKAYWLVYFAGPLVAAACHVPIYLWAPPDHVAKRTPLPVQAVSERGDGSGEA
jgi:glycerol uptake facilitator-like aquaporin